MNLEKLYIDTHTHYCDTQFNEDREELLAQINKSFYSIVEIGCNKKSSLEAILLAKKYDFIYCTIGIHPSDVKFADFNDIDFIKDNAKNKKVVAIGEIGLDYFHDKDDAIKTLQKRMFILQIDVAKKNKLPIVVHSRQAAFDTFDIIKSYAKDIRGIIHCYSYSYETAKEYVKLGYYLGIGGVLTYKNSPKLQEVVKNIPLEYLVLETDCPYLSPVPNRGKRNSSLNLPYVVQKIAELKNISVDEVLKITYENAKKIYNI